MIWLHCHLYHLLADFRDGARRAMPPRCKNSQFCCVLNYDSCCNDSRSITLLKTLKSFSDGAAPDPVGGANSLVGLEGKISSKFALVFNRPADNITIRVTCRNYCRPSVVMILTSSQRVISRWNSNWYQEDIAILDMSQAISRKRRKIRSWVYN